MDRKVFGYVIVIMAFLTLVAFIPLNAGAVSSISKASTTWAKIKVGTVVKIQTSEDEILVSAAPPRNSIIYRYITDVTPVRDGVQVTLSVDGIRMGKFWNWARVFADWTVNEYERQSGRKWPFHKRSKNSVANEIMAHCYLCSTPWWPRTFPVNIGFDERIWD